MSEPRRQAIFDHVTRWVGAPEAEISVGETKGGPISLLHILPSDAKPFHVLVTNGMSGHPMTVPPESQAPDRMELMLSLPPDWPIGSESLGKAQHSWPFHLLANLARVPALVDGWFETGHTIPNGEPPQPYLDTLDFCGALIAPPVTVFPEFFRLRTDEEVIGFYAVVPLFSAEMELKLTEGAQALLNRLEKNGVTELLDVQRASTSGTLIELINKDS